MHAEATFAGGKKPAMDSPVDVLNAASGEKYLETRTDEAGKMSFTIPQAAREAKADLKLVLHASMGHQSEWTVEAAEYLGASGDESAPQAVAAPQPDPGAAPAPRAERRRPGQTGRGRRGQGRGKPYRPAQAHDRRAVRGRAVAVRYRGRPGLDRGPDWHVRLGAFPEGTGLGVRRGVHPGRFAGAPPGPPGQAGRRGVLLPGRGPVPAARHRHRGPGPGSGPGPGRASAPWGWSCGGWLR